MMPLTHWVKITSYHVAKGLQKVTARQAAGISRLTKVTGGVGCRYCCWRRVNVLIRVGLLDVVYTLFNFFEPRYILCESIGGLL